MATHPVYLRRSWQRRFSVTYGMVHTLMVFCVQIQHMLCAYTLFLFNFFSSCTTPELHRQMLSIRVHEYMFERVITMIIDRTIRMNDSVEAGTSHTRKHTHKHTHTHKYIHIWLTLSFSISYTHAHTVTSTQAWQPPVMVHANYHVCFVNELE